MMMLLYGGGSAGAGHPIHTEGNEFRRIIYEIETVHTVTSSHKREEECRRVINVRIKNYRSKHFSSKHFPKAVQ